MRDMIFFKTQPLGYPYKLINRKLIHSLFFFTLTLMQFVFIFSLHGLSLEDKGEIKLKEIHSRLKLVHGSFSDEYPEQLMSAMFANQSRPQQIGVPNRVFCNIKSPLSSVRLVDNTK